MFCRMAGVAAAALLISGMAWAQSSSSSGSQSGTTTDMQSTTTQTGTDATGTQTTTTETTTTQVSSNSSDDRPRLEVSGFAGWTFNQQLDFTQSGGNVAVTNFYDSVGPKDRFSYGASLGYDVTHNLMIGARWSAQNNATLQLRNFNSTAAAATGWTPSTGPKGTVATTAFPAVLLTANGAAPYDVGKFDINNFHGILQWNFGPGDSVVRPFVFGGAGVTRYGDMSYQFAQAVTTPATDTTPASTTTTLVKATLPGATKFSTTWGVGVNVAPRKGLGIRVEGNWTPARVSNAYQSAIATPAAGVSANAAWWCNAFSGCTTKNYSYANQWSVLGGVTLRF